VIRKFLDSIFFLAITAFTCCSMLCPVPFKVDTFQLDTVNPAILLSLEEFAKVFCPKLPRYIQQFFLNHAVIKSPSLQQQLEFWKKIKGHRVLVLRHRGCRTTGRTLLDINACTNKAEQSRAFCSNLLHA